MSSGEIVLNHVTQRLIVDMPTRTVSIIMAGPIGPAGPNPIPPGGTTGQVLAKLSDDDYDVGWVDP